MKYKIEELCEINSENISKSDDIKYIYYLDTSNLTRGTINEIQKLIVGKDKLPSRAKRKVKVNDILISTVRPNQRHYGIIRKEIENLIVSTGFAVLSPNLKKVNPEYLYWYLTHDSIVNYLQSIAETSTSAYPSIKPSVIGGLEIDLPKLEEQKAIANILSTLDEKIETNNQINEKLEEMAQALFKHWFVDFEFPNENGEPYKSSGGEMVESELGMIPKGWEICQLDDLVDIIDNRGKTPPLSQNKTNYPIIDVKALTGTDRIVNYDNCSKFVDKNTYETWFRSGHPKTGDILLSTVGSIGELKLFFGDKGCIAQNVVALRTKNISYLYLFQYMRHIKKQLISYNIGSVQPSIKITHVKKHKILVPKKDIEDSFTEIIKNISFLIFNNSIENQRLVSIRDTLLPKLMSGEIHVSLDDEVLSEKN
ncbi:restriction endonuclease subunit S [Caldibacillus thermoamylovorans]|uniref:restriction endonuclease subunit S n=1 Tax=Caldibacillus thermoamylovorans TaxID=35841 RepID=UPI00203BE0D8|nr:restriction endonuclease subunit S [Caldibacillus thermoamylovorans]MCM3055128.1 restriction endonuclease subunit S [Caldibacillus thermoamylovorans]